MRVGVIGLNHKLADLKLRESLAKVCLERFNRAPNLHDDHTLLLLSTCNRTEIYFSSDDLATAHSYLIHFLKHLVPEPFDQRLYSYFNENCFLHLCRVVAGLDSAIAAETEIQGQVKGAYEKARQTKRLPKELHYLFQKALKIGKLIRTQFTMGRGMPDIEHALLDLAHRTFAQPELCNILIVGASSINLKIIHHFKSKQFQHITLCNRTTETAERIALQTGIEHLPWKAFDRWQEYDWVIFGTKSKEHLLKASTQLVMERKKLLIDLSVPRNIDPQIAHHPGIELFDIDQIHHMLQERRERLGVLLSHAEQKIALETAKQILLFKEKEKRAPKSCILK